MTEKDLIIQDLKRENTELKKKIEELTRAPQYGIRPCGDGNYYCDGLCITCIRSHVQYQGGAIL